MSGYDWSTGMSNNAVNAYDRGLRPLSKLNGNLLKSFGWKGSLKFAKFLATCGAWKPSEWHHCSSKFNKVNFYNPDDLIEIQNDPEELEILRGEFEQSETKSENSWLVEGTYTEFVGTRKRARKREIQFTGVLNGNWIFLDQGGKKKADGNWIHWSFVK